jgi:hypothetical protein
LYNIWEGSFEREWESKREKERERESDTSDKDCGFISTISTRRRHFQANHHLTIVIKALRRVEHDLNQLRLHMK